LVRTRSRDIGCPESVVPFNPDEKTSTSVFVNETPILAGEGVKGIVVAVADGTDNRTTRRTLTAATPVATVLCMKHSLIHLCSRKAT
jgi:hypothetical protein